MPPPGRYEPLDFHDPTRGIGGAPPARSALGLRLGLAAFGVVICAAGAVAFAAIDVWPAAVALAVLAVVGVADAIVVVRRMRVERKPPGVRPPSRSRDR